MIRRPAITLVEVLVAMFVTALGMLALLVLFPLGALNMAEAIKDDNAALAAANAGAVAEFWHLRKGNNIVPLTATPPETDVFANPAKGTMTTTPAPADPVGKSWPVFVDAIGFNATTDSVAGLLPRRTVSFAGTSALKIRWFTLMDSLNFNNDGVLATPVQRESRISWAYLLQRPRTSEKGVVDLTVVVYSGRSLALGASGLPSAEDVYTCILPTPAGTPQGTTLTVMGTANIRRGSWVLDATQATPGTPPAAVFYRVVNVTPSGPNTILEVETPVNPPCTNLIAMDNVVEVMKKGTGWTP